MAKLAIRGHEKRGEEVIEILQMLGGKKTIELCGNATGALYSIFNDRRIDYFNESRYNKNEHEIFTLEEFLKKFPYKVGDKVIAPASHNIHTVESMHWDGNQIYYNTVGEGFNTSYTSKELQPYKEETMEEKEEKSANHVFDTEIISFDIAQRDKYELDLQGKFKVVLREGVYYIERIKPQYPKTYEECLKILGYNIAHTIPMNHGHNGLLMMKLQRLLIFRDAYWKIAGEQMGLGKPWEPDWKESDGGYRYCIVNKSNNIALVREWLGKNYVLSFPTAEMRDTFYENFKSLIEKCKELL